MSILTGVLVGAHFHPPAEAMLEHLPAGVSLRLEWDSDNPYDERAIGVAVRPSSVPESQRAELGVKLPGMGFDLEELLASDEWLALGHVGATEGNPLGKALLMRSDLIGNAEIFPLLPIEAKLGFDGSGLTLVIVETREFESEAVQQ